MTHQEKKPSDYPFPVFHTQGGGLAKRSDPGSHSHSFVQAPDSSTGLGVGDLVPAEWDLVPANEIAKNERNQEDRDINDGFY